MFTLKKWLTLDEAAKHLSTTFQEPVSEADVLQCALDGDLQLSVYMADRIYVQLGRVTPEAEVKKIPGLHWESAEPYLVHLGVRLNDSDYLVFDERYYETGGLFDLPMIGGDRVYCQRRYDELVGLSPEERIDLDGTFLVEIGTNRYLRVCEELLPEFDAKPGERKFHPVGVLEGSLVLVVRPDSLAKFIAHKADSKTPTESKPEDLSPKERDNLYRIIGALFVELQTVRKVKDTPLIADLSDKWTGYRGLGKRNLEKVIPLAKKLVDS